MDLVAWTEKSFRSQAIMAVVARLLAVLCWFPGQVNFTTASTYKKHMIEINMDSEDLTLQIKSNQILFKVGNVYLKENN